MPGIAHLIALFEELLNTANAAAGGALGAILDALKGL